MSATPQPQIPQVFISYAHADNQRFDEGTPGWVSGFVDRLQKAIAMQPGGSRVTCWMDHRLEPQRKVDATLKKLILESACILAFLSPRYLESEWCGLEMDTFVDLVGGGSSDDRVFLIELLPTIRDAWHEGVRDISAIQSWESSFENPEPKIIGWPAPDPKGDRAYWTLLNSLATRLARQIKNLPLEPNPVPSNTPVDRVKPVPLDSEAEGPLRLIINADKPDRDLGKRTQELLDEWEVETMLAAEPAPNQPPAEYRQNLSEQLGDSHGVLIVYGEAPPSWVQSQYALASKVLAMRKQAIWGGLLDGPPQEKPDHGLPSRRLQLLNCRNGLDPTQLKGFVDTLRGNGHV